MWKGGAFPDMVLCFLTTMVAYSEHDFKKKANSDKILFPLEGANQFPGLAEVLLSALRVVLGDAQIEEVQD